MSGVAEPAFQEGPPESREARRHRVLSTLHTRKPPGESVKPFICCDHASLDTQPQSCE